MADRKFSWQKENPIANPAKYAEIMADIDRRNPTKPGQYTGLPVPADQKEDRQRKKCGVGVLQDLCRN